MLVSKKGCWSNCLHSSHGLMGQVFSRIFTSGARVDVSIVIALCLWSKLNFFPAEVVEEMPVPSPCAVGGSGCPIWNNLCLARHNSLPAVILLNKSFLSSFPFPFDPTKAEPACRPSQDRSLNTSFTSAAGEHCQGQALTLFPRVHKYILLEA